MIEAFNRILNCLKLQWYQTSQLLPKNKSANKWSLLYSFTEVVELHSCPW